MELSLYLAKLLGIYLIVMGFFWFLRRDYIRQIAQDFHNSPSLVAFAGALALLGGLALVIGHPVLEWSWRNVITLLGIVSIARGFMRLFALDYEKHLLDVFLKDGSYKIVGTLSLLLGLFLTYRGFSG